MNKIDSLTKALKVQAQIILDDVDKALQGNKAAARRVRKATLELGNRCGKEYRAESVAKIG
jgi:hypothetical protein